MAEKQPTDTTLSRVIEVDAARLGGVPVFHGTGVSVKSLFDHLRGGDSLDSFLTDFPGVSRTQAQTVVDLAAHYLLRAIFEQ